MLAAQGKSAIHGIFRQPAYGSDIHRKVHDGKSQERRHHLIGVISDSKMNAAIRARSEDQREHLVHRVMKQQDR